MSAWSRRRFAASGVLVLAVAAGCHAQEDTFYGTVFTCNAAEPGDQCGLTRERRPMTCFAGSQLGGDDFCAEACDPTASVADPTRFACLDSGALLQICHPGAVASAAGGASFDCPKGLSCYRTDLLDDVGICLSMRVCTEDADCASSLRSTCATTVVRDFFGDDNINGYHIGNDHLQCLATGCANNGCPSGEFCLGDYINEGPIVDNLCVPACDSQRSCPPNYFCANNPTSAPGAPMMCEPGVLGARCARDQDCFIGSCVNFGLEFNVCAFQAPCSSDADCATFATGGQAFVCAGGPPGVCTSLTVFHGADCKDVETSIDCAPGTGLRCFDYSASNPILPHGECRMPCRDDGTCPSRGGIPHTCLGKDHEGGCYPGQLGMPCMDSSQCLQGLACEAVPFDPRSLSNDYSPSICTVPCASDTDCLNHPLTPGDNYCSCAPGVVDAADGSCRAGMGFCRPGGWIGTTCERDEQCASRNCNPTMGACIAAVRN